MKIDELRRLAKLGSSIQNINEQIKKIELMEIDYICLNIHVSEKGKPSKTIQVHGIYRQDFINYLRDTIINYEAQLKDEGIE